MDAVAALAFGIVIINGLKDKGVTKKKDIIHGTIYAGLIAAGGLIIVYLSLGWIGRVLPHNQPLENGAKILVLASQQLFGYGGNVLFGVIVILACLTTCAGLISACSRFFNGIFPRYSYKNFVFIFVIIGLLFTNFGLEMILQVAAPLLVLIYPVSIVLVILSLFQYFFGESKKMYIFSVSASAFFAIFQVLDTFNIQVNVLKPYLTLLPLHGNGLGWTIPALLAAVIGYALDNREKVVYRSKN